MMVISENEQMTPERKALYEATVEALRVATQENGIGLDVALSIQILAVAHMVRGNFGDDALSAYSELLQKAAASPLPVFEYPGGRN